MHPRESGGDVAVVMVIVMVIVVCREEERGEGGGCKTRGLNRGGGGSEGRSVLCAWGSKGEGVVA